MNAAQCMLGVDFVAISSTFVLADPGGMWPGQWLEVIISHDGFDPDTSQGYVPGETKLQWCNHCDRGLFGHDRDQIQSDINMHILLFKLLQLVC